MADKPIYYNVKPKTFFEYANVVFRPGLTYRVSPEIFEGKNKVKTLSGEEKPFKDLVDDPQPEYEPH